MKLEEKKILKKEKIIFSASTEFGLVGYKEASLNTICKNAGIAKGTLYLYFEDKKDIYLECLRECYDSIYTELQNIDFNELKQMDIMYALQNYFCSFDLILDRDNLYKKLYLSTFFHFPIELKEEVLAITKNVDEFNHICLKTLLLNTKLRENIDVDTVIVLLINHIRLFQKRYQDKISANNKEELLKAFQNDVLNMLDMFLFGIVEHQ